ncbi:MAG: hypothetical protein DBY43_05755 [Clostridiaceae bacterium]|nr:MAG: hypothetical protein DBY43_05755 [Clostridiaceae bacterium]
MGKQNKSKKKDTPISSLDKAFGTAAHFPSLQPAEFRRTLTDFRQRAKGHRKWLGLTEDITCVPTVKQEDTPRFAYIRKEENNLIFTCVVRDILLDAWYQKKVVFTISKEVLDYIGDVFHVQDMETRLTPLIECACHDPIYIEFEGMENIHGVFCGMTRLTNESMNFRNIVPAEPIFTGILLEKENAFYFAHYHERASAADFFRDTENTGNSQIVMKALVYIGYMCRMNDSLGTVFIEKNRRDARCYEVRPCPFPEAAVDFSTPIGWSSCGLAALFYFLSNEHFWQYLQEEADETYLPSYGKHEQNEDGYNKVVCHLSEEWEHSKTIYQYDSKTADAFRDKYMEKLLLNGFTDDLLWYKPQPTIILFQQDTCNTVLISTGKISNSKEMGIYLVNLREENYPLYVIPATAAETLYHLNDFLSDAIYAFYHILSVYQDKAMKKAQRDTLHAGNPDTTDLLQTYEPRKNHPRPENDGSIYRTGEDVGYIPMPSIFDLTSRTVKRVPRPKGESGGWHVIPHTRRPHPHRYWVGSGENRHMEVRYLESMRIHPNEHPDKTTLKNLV